MFHRNGYHRTRLLAPTLAALMLLTPLAPLAYAGTTPTDCAGTVTAMVDALNNGDLASAQQAVSPSMTVTLPGGQTLPIGGMVGFLPAGAAASGGGLPSISIAALSPENADTVDVTLSTSIGQTQARIQCAGGQITSIQLTPPSSSWVGRDDGA